MSKALGSLTGGTSNTNSSTVSRKERQEQYWQEIVDGLPEEPPCPAPERFMEEMYALVCRSDLALENFYQTIHQGNLKKEELASIVSDCLINLYHTAVKENGKQLDDAREEYEQEKASLEREISEVQRELRKLKYMVKKRESESTEH